MTSPASRSRPGLARALLLLAFIAIFFLTQCGQTATPRPTPTHTWYEGGTLHESNLGEWREALGSNRLATAADFLVSYANQAGQPYSDIDSVRLPASELVECIDETASAPEQSTQPTADIAILCMRLMALP